MRIAHNPIVAWRSDVIHPDVVSAFTRSMNRFKELIASLRGKIRNWEADMARYLKVENEPVAVCCYTCSVGFGFFDYDKLLDSRCAHCSTPLFLPHELEGIGNQNPIR